MSDQLCTDGDIATINGIELECTSVTYQEDEERGKHSFVYSFRPKAELDAEREELAAREAEALAVTKTPTEEA